MKRTEPLLVREIIEQAFQATGHTDALDRHRLAALWGDIVGTGINRMTVRRWVERDILHVTLTSAVLRQELSLSRQTLVKALNAAVGRNVITDIRFH